MEPDDTLVELAETLRAMAQASGDEQFERELGEWVLDHTMRLVASSCGIAFANTTEQRPYAIVSRDLELDEALSFLKCYTKTMLADETTYLDLTSNPVFSDFTREVSRVRAATVFPLRDPGHELCGAVVAFYEDVKRPDVARVQMAQHMVDYAALAIANERLRAGREYLMRQSLLEKSQEVIAALTAGIAHDFNNLLGGMLGLVTLAPTLGKEELEGLCSRLKLQVEQAANLTRNLLQVSRTTQPLEQEPVVELNSAVADAVAMVRPTVKWDIDIRVESPDAAVWAATSPMAFSRVVLNLLVNGIQALEGVTDARIVVRVSRDDSVCRVEVEDNGHGVPHEQAERIFLPFVSLGKSGGIGVGLAAARGILQRAGGSLELKESAPGGCFVVKLPVARGDVEVDVQEPQPSPGRVGSGRRLLLAEDEPLQRRVFAEALREAGFLVDEVGDGHAAERAIETQSYAAALLDVAMPGVSGVTILGRLRAQGAKLPVVLVTGLGEDPALSDVSDAVTHVISKPLEARSLVQKLELLLRQ